LTFAATPSPNLLEVEDLSVDIAMPRGTLHAVRNVSLAIRHGETLCIVGESGCGKSMTALAIMGLLPRSARLSGRRLSFSGENLLTASQHHLRELRGNRITMIFQEPMTALNPAYTVGNLLIEVHRRHKGSSFRAARNRALDLLQETGIANPGSRLHQYPHELSGGLRQRIMIAMALMCAPDLLIADEPTTALDVTIQAQILRLLTDLQRRFGIALILITHDLGIVARIADRVAVMYAGEIVESGPASAVFANPCHPYTRGLIDCLPIPGKSIPGEQLSAIPGQVPSLIGDIAGCAFHPRCLHGQDICLKPVKWVEDGAGHGLRCVLGLSL
jgi:peptide/nickel transport system ATP-binding protein